MSVGLHPDLGEWDYREGTWIGLYEVIPRGDSTAVAEEISQQLALFQTLMGKQPTHIDSHQHVHHSEPVRSIVIDRTRRLDVPLRLHSETHHRGDLYGQTDDGEGLLDQVSISALTKLLDELPAGITELGCHLAKYVDFDTMYTFRRLLECEVLCARGVRRLLAQKNIQLCSFYSQFYSLSRWQQ